MNLYGIICYMEKILFFERLRCLIIVCGDYIVLLIVVECMLVCII